MADFNAFPALDVRVPQMQPGPDLGSIFEQANKIQAGRNENSLFPLKQQAYQTENDMNQLTLAHVKTADQYANAHRKVQAIAAQLDSGDTKGAEKAWEDWASDPSTPEGKQWRGKLSDNSLDAASRYYAQQGQLAVSKASAAASAAQQQQQGNAFDGSGNIVGSGVSASQNDFLAGQNPQQTDAIVQSHNKAAQEFAKLRSMPFDDAKAEWNQQLANNPNFKTVVGGLPFSRDNLERVSAGLAARQQTYTSLGINAAEGLPNPREPLKLEDGNAYDIYNYTNPLVAESPQSKEKTRSDKAHEADEREKNAIERLKASKADDNNSLGVQTYWTDPKDGAVYPVLYDKAGKATLGPYPSSGGGKYGAKAGMTGTPDELNAAAQNVRRGGKINDYPASTRLAINKLVEDQNQQFGKPAFGTTGSKENDVSVEGYATNQLDGAGGLTQSAVDSGADYLHENGEFPKAPGGGAISKMQQTAIANRSAEKYIGQAPTKKGGMTEAQRQDAAQMIVFGDAKYSDFPKSEAGDLNSRVKRINESGNAAFGTTGSKEIDITAPGYATIPIPGTGGMTQSSIDSNALIYASNNGYPTGLGIGSGGPTGAQKKAYANRANEMFPGVDPTERKAKATALMRGMSDQTKYAMTTERALRNFEQTFQQLTDKYKGKINNYDMPIANAINNAKDYSLGKEDINAFKSALTDISAEYSILKSRGGQNTVEDKQTADRILNGNLSMKSLIAIKDELSELGTTIVQGAFNEANSAANQLSTTRGGAAIAPISGGGAPRGVGNLSPAEQKELDDLRKRFGK